MNHRSYLVVFILMFSLSSIRIQGGENVMPYVQIIEAEGFGPDRNSAVQDACRNAVRQASTMFFSEHHDGFDETVVRFKNRDETSSGVEKILGGFTTRIEGELIEYEVIAFEQEESGAIKARIYASVKTEEGKRKDFETAKNEGIRQYKSKNFLAAIAAFERAMTVPGYENDPYVMHGLDIAQSAFNKQSQYQKEMKRAIGYFRRDNFSEAEKGFQQVLLIDEYSNDKLAKKWLDETRRRLLNTTYEKMSLEEGIRFYHARRYSEAIATFKRASNDPEARKWLQRTEDAQSQYNATIAKIQASIKEGDDSFFLNYKTNHYLAAQAEAESALVVYPDDPRLRQFLRQTQKKIEDMERRKKESNENSRRNTQELSKTITGLLFGGRR